MPTDDQKKIKDFLNSPDKDLLKVILNQYDTPNADLAKWTLNYRLYDTMVELTQSIKENNAYTAKHNRYMLAIAIFMALMTAFNLIMIFSGNL